MQRHAGIDVFHEAASMAHEALSIVASGCRDNDELDAPIPAYLPEAEAAGSVLIAHRSVHQSFANRRGDRSAKSVPMGLGGGLVICAWWSSYKPTQA